MEHDETGCQPAPEGPTLCANNCGFFGSPANMNLCSKCYKDSILKQEQAKRAASSIESFVNGSSSVANNEQVAAPSQNEIISLKTDITAPKSLSLPSVDSTEPSEPKAKQAPKRCSACKKRVGLTGFECRCGELFCGSHRYADKHECPFDYRGAGRDAIARANPVVKAEKLDKI